MVWTQKNYLQNSYRVGSANFSRTEDPYEPFVRPLAVDHKAAVAIRTKTLRLVEEETRLRGHLKSSHIADKRKNFHMGGRGFGPDSLCDRQ